jgi:hypothetical protein
LIALKDFTFKVETLIIKANVLMLQVLAAISVSLGSMIVGFSSGYTSPALVKMQEDNSTLTISPQEVSTFGT